MIYESTASFTVIDENANAKTRKSSVILDGYETFSEVEAKMYDYFDGMTDLDVMSIKRSRLKEIANKRTEDDENIFIAEVCDTFTDDNGDEKEISYKIAFFSSSINSAKSFIDEYLKQGYDMRLKSLTETKFVDVI